jgi:gliding motility-associated-like protein
MKILKSQCCLIILLFNISIVSVFGITAKFTYTKRSNCAPTPVEFINASTTGTNVTYTWDFGLGAVISASDNSVKEQLYTRPGQYKVTLTVSDGSNTVSTSTTITISQGPKANFAASPVHGCSPLLVNYNSTSTPGDSGIVSILWDFRNGDYGNSNPIQYTYNTVGKYDVVLKVIDKNGCYDIIESDSLINVVNKPIVSFKATDTFACTPPLNVSFINLSSGATYLTYKWDYGNGKTSTDLSNSSVYNSTGSFDVKLTVTDQYGCKDSLVKKSYIKIGNGKGTISVYDSNNKIVSKSSLCSGTYKFVFSLNDLPDYTWTIRDKDKISTITGQNAITYLVQDTGTLKVSLIYGKNSSCIDSISKTFKKSYIKAGFTSDTLFCSIPQKVSFQNSSQNANNFSWYFAKKSFSVSDNALYTITKNDLPAETYQQLYSREINKIKLPFKLVATNGEGCTDSITKEITISFPVARFMPDKVSGCIPLQVSFSDSSKSIFTIDEYTYKIGSNLITAVNKTPVSYTFTSPGEYFVSEIIKSGTCYDTSYAVKIVVGEKLTPDFTVSPTEVCNGGKIHIVGNSNNNSVVKSWQFKSVYLFDYNFTAKPDTSITVYSDTAGYKNISLQINYNGCFSSITKNSIFKITGPTGNFVETFSCDSALVYHFKSKITPATSLAWNVDTAKYQNVDSVRYKFPASGNYTVKLTATDNSSTCTLTRSKLIKVRQIKAGFTINDSIFCAGDTVKLNASSSEDYISSCYNEGFLWDFGDNSPSKRTFVTTYDHIYSSKGKFKILLVTKADNGCTDSTKKTVRVYRPAGSFTTDKKTGCLPSLAVKFNDTSTDTTIVNWVWNFGDQTTDTTKKISVTHTYSSTIQQTYNAALIVYDAYQCYSSTAIPITLIGINSDFQADDNAICSGQTVTFNPVDKDMNSLIWNFGDGNTSNSSNKHTYNKQGQFSVSLTASKGGCSDTITKTNYISVEKADANFSMTDSAFYCYPDTIYFVHNNLNGSPAVDRLWTFESHPLTGKNSDSVKYTYTKPGNYNARLTVTTLNNCKASNAKNIVIAGPTASFSFSPKKICYNEVVNFQLDSITNITSWKWLFGDGATSTDNPASHRYTSRGSIVPSILLMNKNCNTTKLLDTLFISKTTADFYKLKDSLNICNGSKTDFLNRSTNSMYYSWELNNVVTSTENNLNGIIFSKTGDYYVKLTAIGTDNCIDSLTKTYTVIAGPDFSITGDSIICTGQDSINLTVKKETGWSIKWTPATGLGNPTAFTTAALPTNTITYTALVTNADGCSASKEKTIGVNQPVSYSRTPLSDTTINLGENIHLIILVNASNLTYSWSPNYNISCLNCYNPLVAPTNDVIYKVEVKNNCYDFIENFNIKVINDFYLEAPSAFTPNGDANNDIFKFEKKNIKSFELKIFNRWGEIVFSTNIIQEGWDGSVNGHLQNIDTYVYMVKAETIHGYKFEKKGKFLLLK